MKQQWMNFEEWQLMVWWFKGCPSDAMPGAGENQPKLTDFITTTAIREVGLFSCGQKKLEK
jgi:hypothetical protein